MTYSDDLLKRIRDPELWPTFSRAEFLEELDTFAESALEQRTVEGSLAALLIYHQLTEELLRLLLEDARFFIQLRVYPFQLVFPTRRHQMFGQLLDELKLTVDFPRRDEIVALAQRLNEHRIELVHKLTRRTALSDVSPAVQEVERLYSEIFAAFEEAHDHFRLCFKDLHKDEFDEEH